jgi:chloramphenicol 3-O-phosphotransferase
MEKVFVAKRVAKKLFETEAAVDQALAEAADFMSEVLKARKDVKTSMVFADDVQVKLMDAMRALSEARTAMVGVHNELSEAQLRLGIRTEMRIEDKPTNSPLLSTEGLRQVG